LTHCYTGGCYNETLQIVTPDFVRYKDVHGDLVSLTRVNEYPSNLIQARLADDLLSVHNRNGTVLPAEDFTERYVDLSNPNGTRPFVTVVGYEQYGSIREMNKTSTTWNIFNTTSGSNGTITFTACVIDNETGHVQMTHRHTIVNSIIICLRGLGLWSIL
jgi:hypothetical protein